VSPAGAAAGAAGLEAGPAPERPASPAPRNIAGPGDYGLREKMLKRLSSEPGLGNAGWKLALVNGGAVFSGTVPTWSLKRRALALAGATRGIVNVTDQMQVPRGDVRDDQIVATVSQILKERQETLGVQSFEVEAQDGSLILSGKVKDFASRVRVEELAGTVGGVTQIANRLRPADAPSGTDDATLRRAVASYLRDSRSFSYGGEIEVQVKEAEVVLTGRLPYFLARQQAGAMAGLVGGVAALDNRIKVDPSIIGPALSVRELP
jgi:osmotically-inducible protein OsmY